MKGTLAAHLRSTPATALWVLLVMCARGMDWVWTDGGLKHKHCWFVTISTADNAFSALGLALAGMTLRCAAAFCRHIWLHR